ncbi:3-deoxy-manno-octulosonate cytidylyltransferase [bacterium]|jgi:3-deoxy-manno-octulosonate cytidylyltransferase (CMP-KDO synthetase)|nr:3-deoxy-manno-octulosonate cytidylyltransferase [bacterium]MBT3581942.1 3-deoxy-manno-octulosonate cytidylyltransferase [bacterium]MBT4551705.1 3-deoxy-manno-octulosonate cytidylyltransferase [bacterium]MBT7088565.1 3-deoxy-manno-octulosonate cytidylyltransferase [bacterium]
MKKQKTVGIIPARLESSRLPRKALVDICGLPMIVHVYKRSLLSNELDEVYVATDSSEIHDVIVSHGGKAIMTNKEHQTGTDRIAEAAKEIECEIVVNIQGDEALVNPDHINAVTVELKKNSNLNIAILVNPYNKVNSPSDIKAVVNENMEVMYLSRADIPSCARTPNPPMLKAYHIVPFRKSFLLQYAAWPKTKLEKIEYNEYLRILEKGYKIKAVKVESEAVSVDTKEDLIFVRKEMEKDSLYKNKYSIK